MTVVDYVRTYDQNSPILLTIFDEGGPFVLTGRQTYRQKSIRFVTKGTSTDGALDRARALLKWLWDKRTFATATYRVWMALPSREPGILSRLESGTVLADFVLTTFAFQRT
jgi:hypothetical protein